MTYGSKYLFPKFMLTGTGFSFKYMKELIESHIVKNILIFQHEFADKFTPLTTDQITKYSTWLLGNNGIEEEVKKVIVNERSNFELCNGSISN